MAGVSSPLARIERNPRDRSLAARRREVGREEEEEGGGGGEGVTRWIYYIEGRRG